MTAHFDAIVVGAGPAGSIAAMLLARAGWSVALVEKQRFPRRKVCGECLAASNLPLLDALGLGAAFAASAGPELRRVALMQGERTFIADLPPAPHPRHAWGRALGRETLDALLLEQAKASGAVVLQPWAVESIQAVEGGQRCGLHAVGSSQRASLQAPVLIAAHGSWEALPSSRHARRSRRKPGDLLAFKANFLHADLADGLLPVLAFEGGYGGMVVADHGLATLACCLRADRLQAVRRQAPGLGAGQAVEAYLLRQCRGVASALGAAQRQGPWLAAGPLDPGIRLRPGDGLFRIGNAAGEAHPIIGEGMSMAMQSAWLLCAQLLRSPRPQGAGASAAWQREAHQRYAADWRRHFAPRLRLAAVFANLAMRPALSAPCLALLRCWPALLTQGARWGGKTRCAASLSSVAWLASGTKYSDTAMRAAHTLETF